MVWGIVEQGGNAVLMEDDLAPADTFMPLSVQPRNPLHCKSLRITFRNGDSSSFAAVGENRSRKMISLSVPTECQNWLKVRPRTARLTGLRMRREITSITHWMTWETWRPLSKLSLSFHFPYPFSWNVFNRTFYFPWISVDSGVHHRVWV